MADYFEIFNEKKIGVFRQRIDNKTASQRIAKIKNKNNDDDSFMILNLSSVIDKYIKWKKELPRVKPYYAVKCNDDPILLTTLGTLGCTFDCASKNEMDKVLQLNLVKPEDIVYANPCKSKRFIIYADSVGIRMMTFDNTEELLKIKELHRNPEMLLRIGVSDPTAVGQLGNKFGCDPVSVAPNLLQRAIELQVKVIGIAFHIGSGGSEPSTFETAIKYSKELFDLGIKLGHPMKILDIGGGFPGFDTDYVNMDKTIGIVNSALERHFPAGGNYEIIAEPGRFFACTPISVAANIIASVKVPANRITNKESDADKDGFMYYMNNGTYSSFNFKLYNRCFPLGEPLFPDPLKDKKLFHCTVWGPTCDGMDQVEDSSIKRQMEVGEWIYYPNMGAYSSVVSSTFNGFDNPKIYHIIDEKYL
ncbi:hypothetical protein FO519_006840 [Halicephalobus sp. NKZ332]|nr:hypothetical protein FO519_006840 [Halicephalobus sp. NKZ332]